MLRLAHSERYPLQLPEGHRFPGEKYEYVRQQLQYEGLVKPQQLIASEFVPDEVIELTHDPAFWARCKAHQLTAKEIRRIGFPADPVLLLRSWSSASGTVAAAHWALEDGAGMNLAGGTHHAFFDRGEGFCLLNDIAIAANWLLHTGAVSRVLVVDLDVHQGNGTAALFREEPRVFTFSMHCRDNYPLPKERSDLDVELPAGTVGAAYLAELRRHLPRLIEEFRPEILFYQAGVDVLSTDRLGKLSLSPLDCYERDKWVISQAHLYRIPLVVVMGGGYSQPVSHTVRAHANTYKLVLEHYEKPFFFPSVGP
jgi:acetoin utilization deacetylase AcuC-like enzyme